MVSEASVCYLAREGTRCLCVTFRVVTRSKTIIKRPDCSTAAGSRIMGYSIMVNMFKSKEEGRCSCC